MYSIRSWTHIRACHDGLGFVGMGKNFTFKMYLGVYLQSHIEIYMMAIGQRGWNSEPEFRMLFMIWYVGW